MNQNKTTLRAACSGKGKHLTYGKRCRIETLLNEGYSLRYIAEAIDVSPSTVSRDIKKHTEVKESKTNDCMNIENCHKRHICGGQSCSKNCKTCNKCKHYCEDYVKKTCSDLPENGLCNGCKKRAYCSLEKSFYIAETAQREYQELLVGRRNGFDLTAEEIQTINDLVSPLITQGLSPYHIKQALGDKLIISESTLRRMILNSELDVRAVDLKEAVRRKKRRRKAGRKPELPPVSKVGHFYEDYLIYTAEHDVSVVEMDCVEGQQDDKCAILTLHFRDLHMQLYYIMPEHTAECVIEVLDMIENAVGSDLFREMFPVILTDNGHEFTDIDRMERSVGEGKRTMIFFCDPNRSDQKGACENNHKLFRCIVPKGTSIDGLTQSDMVLATNHINSYCRKSLFGSCPYEQAMKYMPEDFFTFLGLERIPPEEVILTPKLLGKKSD